MTREPLTKEKIIKDLEFKQKSVLPVYWTVLPLLVFLLGIGAVGLCMGFSVLLLILEIIIAVPDILLIIFMCLEYAKLHKIKDADFFIVEDRLVGMTEDTRRVRSDLVHKYNDPDNDPSLKKVFTFASYGDYIIEIEREYDRGAKFQYSLTDDMFYLVIMNGKNNTPAMVYNQRVYELKE